MNPYVVAAYYWPGFHDEPRWRPFHRGPAGEWDLIRNCRPKFEGHDQPRVPLWGYEDEADPKVMEKKIAAAAGYGVNVFIFDWYWYEGQPFQERCLNEGFFKAGNNDKIKFFLMWANHDVSSARLDLERGKSVVATEWPGAVDRKTFEPMADYVIERFMKHPSCFKIDGKPVFSIYELTNLIKGFGGIPQTRDALDWFRARAVAAGFPGLHIQAILWGLIPASLSDVPGDRSKTQDNTVRQLGIDSLTNYQWCHYIRPRGDYAQWAEKAMNQWEPWSTEFSVPFYPHVSIDWDTNPRYKDFQVDTICNKSPEAFAECLRKAGDFVDRHNLNPRIITVNAWNEWSEGTYLEPDTKFGMRYLEALKSVFPPKAL